MKIVAVTQARVGSSRLPAKILRRVGDQTLLDLHIERARKAKMIDYLIVATTTEPGDQAICEIAEKAGVRYSLGPVNDVLDRFYQAVKNEAVDYVVRITSDCPLIDPALLDEVIAFALEKNIDYVSNTLQPSFPDGQDIEVMKFSALQKAWQEAALPSEREHVTPYIWKNSSFHQRSVFTSANFAGAKDYSDVRLTVDEPNDLLTITALIERLGTSAGWETYANYYQTHPEIVHNNSLLRNEGYAKSLLQDSK